MTDSDYSKRLLGIVPRLRMLVNSSIISSYREDVLQDILLKLWERRGLYKEDLSFVAWSSKVARNLIIDHIRRVQYRCSIEYPSSVSDRVIENNLEYGELISEFNRLLRNCPERVRQVIGYKLLGLGASDGEQHGFKRETFRKYSYLFYEYIREQYQLGNSPILKSYIG